MPTEQLEGLDRVGPRHVERQPEAQLVASDVLVGLDLLDDLVGVATEQVALVDAALESSSVGSDALFGHTATPSGLGNVSW
jgi:hypothetical protein